MNSLPLCFTRKRAVPIPWTGMVPATPTTIIAQGRSVQKASEQEQIDCPAPESTYQVTVIGLIGGCAERHSLSSSLAAPTFTRWTLDGRRSAGTLSG